MAQVDERTKLMSEFLEPLPEGVQPGPSNLIFGLHIGAKTLQSYWEAFKKADDERKQTALVKQQLRTELLGKKAQTISAVADIYMAMEERRLRKEKELRDIEENKIKMKYLEEEKKLGIEKDKAEIARIKGMTASALALAKQREGKAEEGKKPPELGGTVANIVDKALREEKKISEMPTEGLFVGGVIITPTDYSNLIAMANSEVYLDRMYENAGPIAESFARMKLTGQEDKKDYEKRVEKLKLAMIPEIVAHKNNLATVYKRYGQTYDLGFELTEKTEKKEGETPTVKSAIEERSQIKDAGKWGAMTYDELLAFVMNPKNANTEEGRNAAKFLRWYYFPAEESMMPLIEVKAKKKK